MSPPRVATRVGLAILVGAIGVMTWVGADLRGFFVGNARWKDLALDGPLAVVPLVVLGGLAWSGYRLIAAWRTARRGAGADDVRRRLTMSAFALAVTAPMLAFNAGLLGRALVHDHPREDLHWKGDLIDAADWLSNHRLLVLLVATGFAVGFAAVVRRSRTALGPTA